MFRSALLAAVVAGAIGIIPGIPRAEALVVNTDPTATSTPAMYTQRPADDPGWDHVGRTGAGTGIYLGRGYVLLPRHFTPQSTIRLAGQSFSFDPSFPAVNLAAPASGTGPPDLRIFRIVGDPGLARLPIAASSPAAGSPAAGTAATELLLITDGRTRNTALQAIDGYEGYGTSGTRLQTWGWNSVSHNTSLIATGSVTTYAYQCTFDGTIGDTQGVSSDSGGAAFVYNEDLARWELAGVLLAVYPLNGDTTTALYGNRTVIADLSRYRDQILEITSSIAGDADDDGDVDMEDFMILKTCFGMLSGATAAMGDFDGDGDVDLDDYVVLKTNFGMAAP
ncbi:MAG: hypothetical protein GX591_09365 [Planctomycetes bacterium]|nr:hypothetical protein [Planctomycetota bacterium]